MEQKTAVEHVDGPCLVTAVPGSGKTRTLTSRVVNLVDSGVRPQRILCLTFTNKAANEMMERLSKQIGQHSKSLWVSTFHKLCIAILRKYGNLIGVDPAFSIYDEGNQKSLIEKVCRMREYEPNKFEVYDMMKVANDFREDISDIEDHIESLDYQQAAAVRDYLEYLDEFQAIDFSGLLYKTYLLLRNHQEVVDKLSNKFQYILVDEGQDTNRIQYEIVKMLGNHGNLFVVADRNQSIFAWRGARPENLDLLKQDFQGVREITLPRNYRSTKQILAAAEQLIKYNSDAQDVELITDKGGCEVIVKANVSPEAEARWIGAEMIKLKNNHNYDWHDFAVLYRTNQLSKTPETILRSFEIPYKIFGGFSFFDRSEIKSSIAYLSFLANPSDTIAFERAIQNPKRGIGAVAIGKLEKYCKQHNVSIIDACKNVESIEGFPKSAKSKLQHFIGMVQKYHNDSNRLTIAEVAAGILNESGFYDMISQDTSDKTFAQPRKDNVDELLSGIVDFQDQKPEATLSDYLQSIQVMTAMDDSKTEDFVHLLTMHSAKGLEYKVVFIIGAEKDIVPHKRSVSEGSLDEERRLFYVAMTRAKDHLHISYCKSRQQFRGRSSYPRPAVPSQFLLELGANI